MKIYFPCISNEKQSQDVKPQQRQVLFGVWNNEFGIEKLRVDSKLRILRYSSVMGKVTATSFDRSKNLLIHSVPEEISSKFPRIFS